VVLQRREPLGVEAADAAAHRLRVHAERRGDRRRCLAPAGVPDDAGALDPPRRRSARAGQRLHRRALLSCQGTQANRPTTHGASPAQERPPSYRAICRMNHLAPARNG
jgi:hypothetical protein